jgi:hypothetical protein
MTDLIEAIESGEWAIIPPNQETESWSVFQNFDAEFGYQDQIGSGATLREAVESAITSQGDYWKQVSR